MNKDINIKKSKIKNNIKPKSNPKTISKLKTKTKSKLKTTSKSTPKPTMNIKKISMNRFCEENNVMFKRIYKFLDNPKNIFILMKTLKIFFHPKARPILLNEIKKNKSKINSIAENFHIVMEYYKNNNLVLKSKVGHFIMYFEHNLKNIKVKSDKDYLDFMLKILNYPNLISLLKEIFYVLSDYRSCIYFMTPNIKFRNTNKETINEFVTKFRSNQNMCFSIISGYYPNDNSPWGYYYTGAYASFESLNILSKYYQNPLRELKIDFKYKKKHTKEQILKKISNIYNIKLKKNEKIINITNFIILMKRLKYDMHEVVDSIFKIIYEGVSFKNIERCYVINGIKIFSQKKNYELGIKIYLLVSNGYITNVNCFENFIL